MGIVPFDLEVDMYAFSSPRAYLAVRSANLTLAQAIKSGYIHFVPRAHVVVEKVGGVNIYCWDTVQLF